MNAPYVAKRVLLCFAEGFSFQHEMVLSELLYAIMQFDCGVLILHMFIGCAFLDISPNYSSSLNTLGNTMAALAGLASPIVVAALVSGTGVRCNRSHICGRLL